MTDSQLLRLYVGGSNQAFGELVRRHADWVYSVARRRVRDAHLAEDVAQAAFVVLARKAASLRQETILSAWLFQVVRLTSCKVLREESRRRRRETEAALRVQMDQTSDNEQADWELLEPMLDESVARLGRGDRQAILLRFYERKSFAEVAAEIGSSEDAARKRVSRAIDRLRGIVQRQGVGVAPAVLPALLWNRATDAAPAGLVAAARILPPAQTTASVHLLAKGTILMLNLHKAKVAVLAIATLIAAGVSGAMLAGRATGQVEPAHSAPAKAPEAPAKDNKVASITPILSVQDLPASLDYYITKLGFQKQWEHGDPPAFASVERDGLCIFLAQGEQGQPGTWVYIVVADVNALHEDLVARGATIVDPPSDRPWGMREMLVQDPDGHHLRIGSILPGVHGHVPKK